MRKRSLGCCALTLVLCCTIDDFDGTRSNPYDARGDGFAINLPPRFAAINPLVWEDFDYRDSAGTAVMSFSAYDPNEDIDTLTYILLIGASSSTLDTVYRGRGTSVAIGRLRIGTLRHYRLIVRDRFDGMIDTSGILSLPAGLPPRASGNPTVTASSDRITITWGCSSGVTEYRIYRTDSLQGPFTRVKSVTNQVCSYSASTYDIPGDYADHYYLVASVNANGETRGRDSLCAHRSYTGLSSVSASASDGSYEDCIRVSWTETNTSVAFYRIYRSTSSSGRFLPVAQVKSTGSGGTYSYYDTVSSGNFSYRVAAFDKQGRGGPVGSGDVGYVRGLSAPGSVSATDGYSGYVQITWYAVTGAAGYYIYRSTSAAGTFIRIDSTTSLSYRDVPPTVGAFYYQVSAYSAKGREGAHSYSEAGSRTGVPAPVVSASLGTYPDRVALTWNAVTGASAYVVFRTGTGATVRLDTVTQPGYVDSFNLQPGVVYSYSVASVGNGEEGARSPSVSGRSMFAPILSSVTATNCCLSISFSCVSYATSYNIYRAAGADSLYVRVGATSSCFYSDTARACSLYYYRVTAVNSNGESPRSPARSGQLTLTVPSSLTITSIPGGVELRWRRAACAGSYIVLRSPITGTYSYTAIDTANDTFFVDQLSTDARYYYAVQSLNPPSKSAMSSTVLGGRAVLPATPQNFLATGNPNHIYLSWYDTSTFRPLGYVIYRTSTSLSDSFVPLDTVTGFSYRDTVPLNPTIYYYRVAGLSAAGIGAPTYPVNAKLQAPAAPPGLVVGDGQYGSRIPLRWSSSPRADGYRVYRSPYDTSGFQYLDTVRDTLYNDFSAAVGVPYFYRVTAFSEAGEGSPCIAMRGAVLAPPAGFRAIGYSTHIRLVWQLHAKALGYYVRRSTGYSGAYMTIDTTTDSVYQDTVTTGDAYYYRISSYNLGESGLSDAAGPVRRLPPPPPADLVTSRGSRETSVMLSWIPALGAADYSVYRGTDSALTSPVLLDTTAATLYYDTVQSDTAYHYAVKSRNCAGESVLGGASMGFRTPQRVPEAPTSVTATNNNSAEIILTWSPPKIGWDGFKIYRGTNQQGPFSLIDSTGSRTYADPAPLSFPTRYWYRVAAHNAIGVGALSPAVEGFRN